MKPIFVAAIVSVLAQCAFADGHERGNFFRSRPPDLGPTSSDTHSWSKGPYIPPEYVPPAPGGGYGVPVARATRESIYQDLLASVAMAKALEATGINRQAGEMAVQVVPAAHPAATDARVTLSRFGIEVTSAENGVFLPIDIDASQTGISSRLDADYFRWLDGELKRTKSREEVIAVLKAAKAGLRKH